MSISRHRTAISVQFLQGRQLELDAGHSDVMRRLKVNVWNNYKHNYITLTAYGK